MTESNLLPVARLPNHAGANPLSLAHQKPPVGYLSVRIAFMGEAIEKLKVAFYKTAPDGTRGDRIDAKNEATDEHGRSWVEDAVEVGNYWCVIENQTDAAAITTVDEVDHPLNIPLPVGRPRKLVP